MDRPGAPAWKFLNRSFFRVSPENIDLFIVRDRPIKVWTKAFNEFKEKSFFNRTKPIDPSATKGVEGDSEYFADMFNYFTGYLKSYTQVNEQVLAPLPLVKELVANILSSERDFSRILSNS